jgi:hypothetical protein
MASRRKEKTNALESLLGTAVEAGIGALIGGKKVVPTILHEVAEKARGLVLEQGKSPASALRNLCPEARAAWKAAGGADLLRDDPRAHPADRFLLGTLRTPGIPQVGLEGFSLAEVLGLVPTPEAEELAFEGQVDPSVPEEAAAQVVEEASSTAPTDDAGVAATHQGDE